MKVVWVTPDLPHPERGAGAVLEFEFLRAAASRHEVHLISADHSRHGMADAVRDLGVTVEFVHWAPLHVPRSRLATAAGILTRHPTLAHGERRKRLKPLARALQGWEATHPVDLVHVMQGELAPLLRHAAAPTTLLLFDVMERQMQRELELHPVLRKRVRWGLERAKARAWERRFYPRADGIACVSSVDARFLERAFPGRTVTVLPNAIDDAFFEPPDRPRSTDVVSLVSSLSYRPNIDALTWLADDIWPRVLDACAEARLEVVGASPEPLAVQAARRAGATLHADVPDVRPHYWEAAVSVAPVRLGSGLRNKVIHAMACGAPVVATSAALEGIDAEPGTHVLVADDSASFAAAVVEVLRDPAGAAARAAAARPIAERYRSSAVASALEAWWQGSLR